MPVVPVAEVSPIIVDAGVVAASLTAVAVALGGVLKFPPTRWVWDRLVAGPLGGWLAGLIASEVAASAAEVKAAQDKLSEDLRSHMAEEEALRQTDLEKAAELWRRDEESRVAQREWLTGELSAIRQRLEDGGDRFDRLERAVAEIRVAVGSAHE